MARNVKHHLQPSSEPDTADFTTREITKQEFGRRLLALMLDKGWNQSELARAAGLGRDAISTYIRGVSFPEPKNLHKLAQALGTTTDKILPNVVARAIDSDPNPMLEIRQAQGHPNKVWLRVNRMVTFDTAGKVFALLQADVPEGTS